MMPTVTNFKLLFFDRQKIVKAIGRAKVAVGARAGGLVRTIARRSMRRRKKSSPAGSPPSVHAGQLRDLLFFGYDTATGSTVVGPVPFKAGTVPKLLEFGGTAPRTDRSGKTVTATYAGNPFMKPALTKAEPSLPPMWQNSVKGN